MSGWKEWGIGEVVEAGDLQSYVQDQVVQTYADSTARGSALGTAVSEGMVSYLQDSNSVQVYDGSAWQAVAPVSHNYIINGAMDITQRGTAVTDIDANGYYTADRHRTVISSAGIWTQSVVNESPSEAGTGASLKMEVTTAKTPLDAGSYCIIGHSFEGGNLQQFKKGTASAESMTVSFWAKSNLTGTYVVSFFDNDNTRLISKSYTINASDTWEKKIITFAGDTSGVLDNDNQISLQIQFNLAMGSNFTSGTLGTSWDSYVAANRSVGQVNLAETVGNYWQVTAIQLEAGSAATPFKRNAPSLQGELAACQRYYWQTFTGGINRTFSVGIANNTNSSIQFIQFPVRMRDTPSSIEWSNLAVTDQTAYTVEATSIAINTANSDSARLDADVASGLTTFRPAFLVTRSGGGYIAFSAEL